MGWHSCSFSYGTNASLQLYIEKRRIFTQLPTVNVAILVLQLCRLIRHKLASTSGIVMWCCLLGVSIFSTLLYSILAARNAFIRLCYMPLHDHRLMGIQLQAVFGDHSAEGVSRQGRGRIKGSGRKPRHSQTEGETHTHTTNSITNKWWEVCWADVSKKGLIDNDNAVKTRDLCRGKI